MKSLLINSFISALIGLGLPYTIKFIIYLYRRGKQDNLCNKWYSYSIMIENDSPKIYEGTVKISKGVFSLYKSKIYENGLLYKGNVFIENNHILMIHKTSIEARSETSCVRLDYSAYNMQNRLHGYWLSYDSENYLSCGAIILSKERMDQQTILTEMKAVSCNYENLSLRLSKP